MFSWVRSGHSEIYQRLQKECKMTRYVAAVCDDWKVPTFRKILKRAGYEWTEVPFVAGTTSFKIVYDGDVQAVHAVLRDCERAAQKEKRKKK